MTTVRALVDADVRRAAQLHRDVLSMEFISRCGSTFMRTYYRAWSRSPSAIALVASDDERAAAGRAAGSERSLGTRAIAHAAVHPAILKELIVTRGRRYSRGLLRFMRTRGSRAFVPSAESEPCAEGREVVKLHDFHLGPADSFAVSMERDPLLRSTMVFVGSIARRSPSSASCRGASALRCVPQVGSLLQTFSSTIEEPHSLLGI